jgi:signal transduction histidine kinase
VSARSHRTLWLFIVLAVYIVLQSAWWAWSLVKKDRERERLITAFELHPEEMEGTAHDTSSTLWMVAGEGLVFLMLLLVALYIVYRSVRHELEFARQQRDFLLAVSHELRTPVAGMKLHLQTLERSDLGPEDRSALHLRALADADRLGELTERILLATRLDEGVVPLNIASHDLRELVERSLARARTTIARGHPIRVSGDGLRARVDPTAFTSVIENLLENAAKYAPALSPIDIELEVRGAMVEVRVLDRGPGVPIADRQRIFEKFQRGDDAATRQVKGTGLGLFIVDRLVRRMHGAISVGDRPGGGSTFAAAFPQR